MIDLYYWPTPNGHKITLFLEEAEIDYRIIPVDISKGDQFDSDFLKTSPNNKIPAIIDHDPITGDAPISVFESGAILLYLAEKTGLFLSTEPRKRMETLEWLFWQMGGFGPMLGQNHHFSRYAPEPIPYAINRYQEETRRLYGVLEARLVARPFVSGDAYGIADMATYPWTRSWKEQGIDRKNFPAVMAWQKLIEHRPATQRALAQAERIRP